jgi:rhodanese-related sulfurtransferase
MFNKLKSLFAGTPKVDLAQLSQQGAIILDVRSPREFAGGHISGSLNIPVETLSRSLGKLKDKNRPIITCCASGSRSRIAANILKAQGYANVHNGGGWHSLKSKIGK